MRKRNLFRHYKDICFGLLLVLLAGPEAFASFADDYQFNNPVNMGPNINSPYAEYGMTMTPDGNTIYFASSRPSGYGGYDLYVSHRINGEWQPAENLGPDVNNSRWQYHPAVSPDGTKLYFASDDGQPNNRYTRVWLSEIIDGVPQKAKLLPKTINFSWANNNPRFVTSDGKWLYGSSWYGGMWDIWRVDLSTNDYSTIEDLPAPIISNYRDFTMYVTENYKYMLLFSDRGHLGTFNSYASELVNDVYQEPELLPYPFNGFSRFVNSLYLAEGETIAYFDSSPVPELGYHSWDIYYTTQDGYGNKPPVANAGVDQSVVEGDLVLLDGSNSHDPDDDILSFNWQMISRPEGSNAALADPDIAYPGFTADQPGEYVLALIVNDGTVDSEPDFVTVSVISYEEALCTGLHELLDAVKSLDRQDFKNKNLKNALINKVEALLKVCKNKNYKGALEKLRRDIVAKTDGCALQGSPDKDDWLFNCDSQGTIYPIAEDCIRWLKGIIENN